MPDFIGFVAAFPLIFLWPYQPKIISGGLVEMARPRRDKTPSAAPNKQHLSHVAVKNLQPRERPYTVWDTYQRGLAVVVQPNGKRADKCIYSRHGRARWYSIGKVDAIGLADARKLAGKIMVRVADGEDPQADRKAELSSGTFEDLASKYRAYAENKKERK